MEILLVGRNSNHLELTLCFLGSTNQFHFLWFLIRMFGLQEAALGYFFLPSYFVQYNEIMEIFTEFQNSYHLQHGPFFLRNCMYQLMLFWFYVTVFQILESCCSLFFVTFVFCPLQVLKYCENSHRFLKFNTVLPQII